MALQQRFLDRRQHLVGVAVEARAVLGRGGAGDGLVAAVEQLIEGHAPDGEVRLETRGDLRHAVAGQVVDALVIVVQADLGEPLADALGLRAQLGGGLAEAAGLLLAVAEVAAHLADGGEQAAQLLAIDLGGGGDLADLPLHRHRQVGDAAQVPADVLDLADAAIQLAGQQLDLLDHPGGALLDIHHHLADFLGGGGGAPGQAAHLVGDHRETAPVLAGARRLDGRVERQQVGLAGDGLDHLGDPLDLLAALAERLDGRPAGAGPRAELVHHRGGLPQQLVPGRAAAPRLDGRRLGLAAARRGQLLGVQHHVGAGDDARGGIQLRMQARAEALHRIGHPGGGQRVVAGTPGQLAGQAVDLRRLDRLRHDAAPGRQQARQPEHRQQAGGDRPERQRRDQQDQGDGALQQTGKEGTSLGEPHRIPRWTWPRRRPSPTHGERVPRQHRLLWLCRHLAANRQPCAMVPWS
ncbi:hypothetical protein D9M70_282600 [compost metagenome]